MLHSNQVQSPAWDDDKFLVFTDVLEGPKAPIGGLRFVVQITDGVRQLVIV